jgi:hypothetical protein
VLVTRPARALAGFVLLASIATVGGSVFADAPSEKEICATAYEQAQELHRSGKLRQAKVEAARCGAATCPTVIVPRCVDELRDVEREQPTVVIVAHDESGHDLRDVRVAVDGEVVATKLEGRAIPIDPGPHRMRFEAAGAQAHERDVIIQSAEKERRLEITLGQKGTPNPAASAPVPAAAVSSSVPVETPSNKAPMSAAPAVVAFTFGVLGIGLGAVSGGLALKTKGSLDGVCTPHSACPEDRASDISTMKTEATLATVGFVVGGVGLALGITLFGVKKATDPKTAGVPSMTAKGLAWRF